MNILNLPSPTAAGIGAPIGAGLGLLAGNQLEQMARNKALEYLNQQFPDQQGVYTQEQIEKAKMAASAPMRPFVEQAIQERNIGRQADIARISEIGELGNTALTSVYPKASPGMQNFFRNKALELSSTGVNPVQIRNQLTKDAQNFANLVAQLEKSTKNYDFSIPDTIKRLSDNTVISEKDLADSLKPVVAKMLDYGAEDLVRMQLSQLNLTPSAIDAALGKKLSPEVLQAIETSQIPTSSRSLLTGDVTAENPQDVKNLVSSLYQLDPSQSLLQLRQELVDKGKMNHIQFLQAVNELIADGVIVPDENQLKALADLQKPDRTTSQKLQKTFTDIIKDLPLKRIFFGLLGEKLLGG